MTVVRVAVAAMFALLAASCGPRDVQRPEAPVGRWQGHVAWHDATTPVALEVTRSGDSLAAVFSAPALGVEELPVGKLSYDAPRVHFDVGDRAGPIAFNGWLRRGLVVGALSSGAIAERNPSRLPQLSLKRKPEAPRRLPWPAEAGVDSTPPPASEPQRSLGEWLRARAAR